MREDELTTEGQELYQEMERRRAAAEGGGKGGGKGVMRRGGCP